MVPNPQVVDKKMEGYLRSKVPAPHQTTQPSVPVPGRKVPIMSGYKNKWEVGQKKLRDGLSGLFS